MGHSTYDYNSTWQAFDDMKRFGPMSRQTRRLLRSFVDQLDFHSVLDVGCGQGSPLEYVSYLRPNLELVGIDVSSTAVELARRRLGSASFSVLDITEEALPRTFDLVICSDVLEHIEHDGDALRNMRKMTKKWCLVSTIQGRMRGFEMAGVGHVRNYARGELRAKMEEAGFHTLRQIEWGFPLYSPLYRNLCDRTPISSVSGSYGIGRRAVAQVLYWVFFLNLSRWGDYIWVLAEPA